MKLKNHTELIKKLKESLTFLLNCPTSDTNTITTKNYHQIYYLTPEKISDLEKYKRNLENLKFLERTGSTTTWPSKWVSKLKEIASQLKTQLILEDTQVNSKSIDSLSTSKGLYYYLSMVIPTIRKRLNLSTRKTKINPLMSTKKAFDDLNYSFKSDAGYNKKETFYVSNQPEQILTPHSTAYFVATKETNLLEAHKVYRRENVDATHLCEFTQLEYQKISTTSDPISELKRDLLLIYSYLGLDKNYIEFRPTRYFYTAPSFEIYYNKDDQFIELGGCGVMSDFIPNISEKSKKGVVLAAGIGLERCYMIANNYTSLTQVYPLRYD